MALKICLIFSFFVISSATSGDDFKKLYLETIRETEQWKPPQNNSKFGKATDKCSDYGIFDFVIVGGGTAGAVVANRLSANGTYTVLLLEAGGDEIEFNRVLGNYFYTQKTESNWGYLTEPQRNYCQVQSQEHQCTYHRGQVLGGCSSINGVMHARGNKADFDTWAKLGNNGWSFEEVLPYYKKSENATEISDNKKYHGHDGPFHLSYNEDFPHQELLLQAFNELGLKTIDYNGKQQIGISKPQLAKKNGRRFSTNSAYLQPIKDKRENLKILTHALGIKIKFNQSVATEVHFLHKQECFSTRVNKEVIVSAGVVNSPQLLLLSGIGPKEELSKHNISLIKQLPVGKNFEDHATVPFTMKIKTNQSILYSSFNDLMNETANGKGRLSSGSTGALSFKGFKFDDTTPNYEFLITYDEFGVIRDPDENIPVEKDLVLAFTTLIFHAASRGDVRLKSPDPIDFPKINPNCLSKSVDRISMLKAIKDIIGLLDTETFRKVNGSFDEDNLVTPGCKKFDRNNKYDEEFWNCFIFKRATTGQHGSGTCRMGINTKNSVINPNLKIHGIKNVRVVDASSFPTLPTGHPVATVIMLAEKASDIIIQQNKR